MKRETFPNLKTNQLQSFRKLATSRESSHRNRFFGELIFLTVFFIRVVEKFHGSD